MFNFDQEKIRREHQNGIDIIPQVEKFVDQVCSNGYSNIFYIGIGGTVCQSDDAYCKTAWLKASSFY